MYVYDSKMLTKIMQEAIGTVGIFNAVVAIVVYILALFQIIVS